MLAWKRGLTAGLMLCLPAASQAATYSDIVLSETPVGYWRFEETAGTVATDSSANANHGTHNGGTLGNASADARLGNALTLNGHNVRIPDIAAYDLGTGAFTLEMWYRTGMTGRGDLFTYKGSGGDLGLQHNQNNDGVQDVVLYHTGSNRVASGHQPLNQWYHVVATRSGTGPGQTKLYVNGRLVDTGSDPQTLNISNDILIGSNHNNDPASPQSYFRGDVDEVAFYGSAISADAVRTHYLAAKGRTISVNFVGGGANGGASLNATDTAGHTTFEQANWNNATGNAGSGVTLVDADGHATGATLSWSADAVGALPSAPSGSGSSKMMEGYIDGNASVNVSGLHGNYDVIVYFDGNNGGNWRKSGYTLTTDTGLEITLDGEDSENRNFQTNAHTNGTAPPDAEAAGEMFQLATPGSAGNQPYEERIDFWNTVDNNDEGNFLVFRNITGSSFTLTGEAIGGGGASLAPINGIQIVAIPTPTALPAGLALLGIAAMKRRR